MQGVQTFDGAGNLQLDVGNSVFVLHGTIQTTPNQSGSVSVDTSLGTPFVIPSALAVASGYDRPTVTVSGGTITWTSAPYSAFFFYGTR